VAANGGLAADARRFASPFPTAEPEAVGREIFESSRLFAFYFL
jgi:hypothetical protein